MKSLFIKDTVKYDGTQLSSHYAYKNFGIAGDSIISFIGPVNIEISEMVDIEDVRAKETISSDKMLNFIIEIFGLKLLGTVCLQRLFIAMICEEINKQLGKLTVSRKGDDLFFDGRKLSVSIATASPVSVMIHTALNIVDSGVPIAVSCLEELNIDTVDFANTILDNFVAEFESVQFARVKVDWIK